MLEKLMPRYIMQRSDVLAIGNLQSKPLVFIMTALKLDGLRTTTFESLSAHFDALLYIFKNTDI